MVKLQIAAGKATPAPPVGTALGPQGVNIMDFCKNFNAKPAKHAKKTYSFCGFCGLCVQIFSTCKKSSSTGVERPKIVTMTFSVFLSRLTSSTTPLKLVNGPSLIRTCSPFSNMYFGFGFSAAVFTWVRICSTTSRT